MNTTISKKQKIIPSIKKLMITRIPQLSNSKDINTKIKKYVTSFRKRNPFLSKPKMKTIENDNDESPSFHKNINHSNTYNVNKILKKYSTISVNKTEDENSTTITDAAVRKNNLKKVTFSVVEVIRVENYKKYNKIKYKPNFKKGIQPLKDYDDDEQCSIY